MKKFSITDQNEIEHIFVCDRIFEENGMIKIIKDHKIKAMFKNWNRWHEIKEYK